MSTKPTRLGKGLEALIPKTLLSSGKTLSQLPISEIEPNPYQPRTIFNEEALEKLAESIRTFGVNQPILVRQTKDGYQLIAGERRMRAAEKAGLVFIPTIVKNYTDKQALQFALVENLQREDLDSIETALGMKRLLDEFDMTHQDVADVLGFSRSSVTNHLRLLNLPLQIQRAVQDGQLSMGHARSLLAMESEEEQMVMFNQIITEKMNVRQAEERVNKKKVEQADSGQQLTLFSQMESRLQQQFKAKCKVSGKADSGKIILYYKSKDELSSIFEQLINK